MSKGYEHTYEAVKGILLDCDFAEAAQRLGLAPPVNGERTIPFLGRTYRIRPDGVFAADGQDVDPNVRSILAYYAASKGVGEPADSYSLLARLVPKSMGRRGTGSIVDGSADCAGV